MKIDRLIGIIVVLLQNEKMTAPELAKKFEVSRRTINRDIEDICKAGIPIVTSQGTNGGISIMDNYKIDKTIFSKEEVESIFTGLIALDSIAQGRKYRNIINKFSSEERDAFVQNHILIDLSHYDKEIIAPMITTIQMSIANHTKIKFYYHKKSGGHDVITDPYLLIFEWSSWYVLCYAYQENNFKMYKLRRMSELESTSETFQVREIPKEALEYNSFAKDENKVVILFEASEKLRLIEEYGANSFIEQEDGKLLFTNYYSYEDFILSWVLSFGDRAELIEPSYLRTKLFEQAKNNMKKYEQ